MEAIERLNNGQGGAIERQSEGAGVGAWSHIEKVTFQELDYQTRIGPLFESATVGAARGLFVIVAGAGAIAAAAAVGVRMPESVVWPLLGFDALAGVGVALYTLQAKLGEAFDTYRNRPTARETYTRETQAQAGQTSERLTVEVIERPQTNNGAGRIVYDDLGTDHATLALAVRADVVSKAALVRAGVSERKALDLLGRIVALGYATQSASNRPGEWTAKGRALRRVMGALAGDVEAGDLAEVEADGNNETEGGEQ